MMGRRWNGDEDTRWNEKGDEGMKSRELEKERFEDSGVDREMSY